MRLTIKWLGLGALAVATLTGSLWATGHIDLKAIASFDRTVEKTPQTSPYMAPAVTVVRPRKQAFVERLRVTGSLVAREEILVAPQIEGQRVSALMVDVGDYVEEGQLLATLATENLDALVAQNDATLKRADAAIAQAKSAILQAQARLDETAASLDRAKPLRNSGYLSESIYEQRLSAATSARAALAIAKDSEKLSESEKGQALAQRRELLWRRSHTAIKAPAAGLVLTRAAKVGAIATATGEPMFRIVKAGEIELEGEVTSGQLQHLALSQTAAVTINGKPAITGKVRLVAPRVDPATRLGTVRIFLGRNPALHIGMFAAGIIETAHSNGLGVPAPAVMRDTDGPYVHIVVDKRIAIRRLKLGLTSNGFVEVLEGLAPTDSIIAKAGTFLGPGEEVVPIETPANNAVVTRPEAG